MLLFEHSKGIAVNVYSLKTGKRMVQDKKVEKFEKKVNELRGSEMSLKKMLLV